MRADFVMVNFDHTFNASSPNATQSFHIEGTPASTQDGYLLIQANDVARDHRIQINGRDLPSIDFAPQEGRNRWTLWMDRVPAGFLHTGANRITIIRNGTDNFMIANVVVNWREVG